jgi:hypothetical protein
MSQEENGHNMARLYYPAAKNILKVLYQMSFGIVPAR